MKYLTLKIIRIYQKTLSPDQGLLQGFFSNKTCKYYPTCSNYTYDAIKKFGIIKGTFKGAKRIARCNPWSKGGYDPIKN